MKPLNKILSDSNHSRDLKLFRSLESLVEGDSKFIFQQIIEHLENVGNLPTDSKLLQRILGL